MCGWLCVCVRVCLACLWMLRCDFSVADRSLYGFVFGTDNGRSSAAEEGEEGAQQQEEQHMEVEQGEGGGSKGKKKSKLEARLNLLLRVHPNHPL